jgi:hypothetical protein
MTDNGNGGLAASSGDSSFRYDDSASPFTAMALNDARTSVLSGCSESMMRTSRGENSS